MSIKSKRLKLFIQLAAQLIYSLVVFYFFLPFVIKDPIGGGGLLGGFLPNIVNFIFIWMVGVILIGFYISRNKNI